MRWKITFLRGLTVLLFWVSAFGLSGQNLAGVWKGVLVQQGGAEYTYEIRLLQEGASISGFSVSRSPRGDSALFNLTGLWDNGQLILQELNQLQPKTPRWCLKYAILNLSVTDGRSQLSGGWTADGCEPGRMMLTKDQAPLQQQVVTEEVPFTMAGRWTGNLNQSDRDYSFFYELELQDDGTGFSYIVSEDNGGSARHDLNWTFDPNSNAVTIAESKVVERTDERWPWCIKSARFRLRRANQSYILEGDWEGFIEGYIGVPKGRCAAGSVVMEKPILTRQNVQLVEDAYHGTDPTNLRTVKVARVLEVQGARLNIHVWDNGIVDGDRVTLFLNGERLLYNHYVNKHKMAIPVTLKQDNNFLILHAEDIGSVTPNTVAVSVDDGVKEQTIILSSNLDFSGAVMIRRFKVD